MKTTLLTISLSFFMAFVIAQCPATYTDTINKILHDGINCIDYPIVKIGSQWWMQENVNATLYADSTPLVDGTGAGNITGDLYTKYYFNYNDDSLKAKVYGKLYTWAAVMKGAKSSDSIPSGVQGICPAGWHVPSDAEWKQLEMGLGMSKAEADDFGWRGTDEGGKLKEIGTSHWNSNAGATNNSGFTALPGGWRNPSGFFDDVGNYGHWWSSMENSSPYYCWLRALSYDSAQVHRGYTIKTAGFSVRCVKNINLPNSIIYKSSYEGTIKIYPNPSINGKFVTNSKNPIASLEIYNVLGELVFSQSPFQLVASELITIDLSQYHPGIYFVKVYHDNQISIQKIIIQ